MEIPLFPLPGLVLFPNAFVPLHIFEERYKQMINDCIEGSDPFGLIQMRDGAQEETEQTIHRVGTTARIIQVERLDGGRLNILCQGEARFRISRFSDNTPYWKANVGLIEDEDSDPERLLQLYDEISGEFRRAVELGIELGAVANPADLVLPESPIDLSFMISHALDLEGEQKQKLLEMTSTEGRLRDLLIYVDETVQKLQREIAYKDITRKVRGNGDLGKPHLN